MSLTVLSVGFPLAPVSPDAVGGAEQVLSQLDRALVAAGHRSLVVAGEGSKVAGTLLPVPANRGRLDDKVKARAQARHAQAIIEALRRHPVDLVHMHGIDFYAYLPPAGVSVLATLHVPLSWYPEGVLPPSRPDTWMHCVSHRQHATFPSGPTLLPPIENGVPVEALTARHAKRGFALMLSRICPDKGVHLAIRAAKRAGVPLVIAGELFPYADHLRYFAEEVEPELGPRCRFVGPVGFARKRRLLTAARCLLVPSLAAETSSLAAREAIACGTPVIAFANGGLPETVEDGRTGFLVTSDEEMAAAIGRLAEIDPATCRRVAGERFSLERMVASYMDLYRRLAQPQARSAVA